MADVLNTPLKDFQIALNMKGLWKEISATLRIYILSTQTR